MNTIQAIIMAIVEGITEYLPVSSTGHIMMAAAFMDIRTTDFVKLFTIAIQFGAILSVVVLYFKRFFQSLDFYLKLLVAFLPAVVLGILLGDLIDAALENVLIVALNLFLGGLLLLFVDHWFAKNEISSPPSYPSGEASRSDIQHTNTRITYLNALIIGIFQTIAMIPGVSRSASTIVGGLSQGLNRKTAAEFSFLLAVPTMFAATCKKLYDFYKTHGFPSSEEYTLLLIGNMVAFLVAMAAIRFFINWLSQNGFRVFGWYRIVVGAILFLLYVLGYDLRLL